jgi:hypothetical protein
LPGIQSLLTFFFPHQADYGIGVCVQSFAPVTAFFAHSMGFIQFE